MPEKTEGLGDRAHVLPQPEGFNVFYEAASNSDECRCDLHPRWNRDGTAIYFDSTHEGFRAIYSVDCGETKSC